MQFCIAFSTVVYKLQTKPLSMYRLNRRTHTRFGEVSLHNRVKQ